MSSAESVVAQTAAPIDVAARRTAAEARHSMLVQAPAGSGKTTVLVCRYLSLLAAAESPGEILAITFTRKAAAEMRARVLAALELAARGAPSARHEAPLAMLAWQHSEQRGWRLLDLPGQLRITTIDALNLEICARAPLQAGSAASAQLLADAKPLYLRAARRALLEIAAGDELESDLRLLLAYCDNQWARIEQLLVQMYERRAQWLPLVLGAADGALASSVSANLATWLDERLAQCVACLGEALLREGASLLRASEAQRVAAGQDASWDNAAMTLLAEFEAGGRALSHALVPLFWRLADLGLSSSGALRKRVDVRQGFPADQRALKQRALAWLHELTLRPAAESALRELRRLPEAALEERDRALLDSLARLLRRAAAALKLEFAQQGAVDFTEVAGAARAVIVEQGAPTDWALRFGCALRHILVDEFQDTSQQQLDLLAALTAGWSQGDGRSVFAVGDPMQSIYRFREANVGLFGQVRERGLGDLRFDPLELHSNFRSGAELVEWVNRTLGGLFPAQADALRSAVPYLRSWSARPDIRAECCMHARPKRDDALEAGELVAAVRALRADDPTARVAVLVSSREHAAQIVPALRGAGFGVRGVKLDALIEQPSPRDLLSLTRALVHLGDRAAWLAVLRMPACGLALEDLLHLSEAEPALLWRQMQEVGSLAQCSADARARLERAVGALRPAIDGAERNLRLAERVARCWNRLGGPAAAPDRQDRLDAESYLRLLEDLPEAELCAAGALEEMLSARRADALGERSAIDVLTVHAAKGLEWDAVLLPGLGRRPRGAHDSLLRWVEVPIDGRPAVLLAPLSRRGARSRLGAYLTWIEKLRSDSERLRLLYVACTRARRSLHLFAHARTDSRGELKAEAGSPLADLWPAVAAEFHSASSSGLAGGGANAAQEGEWLEPRLAADWQMPAGERIEFARLPIRRESPGGSPDYDWAGHAARSVGTVVHAELQRYAELRELPLPEAPAASRAHYLAWLQDLGVPAAQRAAAAARIVAALGNVLADERARWLLGARQAAMSEWRLSGMLNGELVNLVMDRSFIDSHGARWVIDYKVSAHEGGSLQDFLDEQLDRYRPQLLRYCALARALGPQPVRAALYFPLDGAWRELPAAESINAGN